jgi:hypothetical protein
MDGPGRNSLYKPEFAAQAFELCLAGATNRDLAGTSEVAIPTRAPGFCSTAAS